MLCMKCRQHGTFEHTVFQGTNPVTIRLCDACASESQAEQRMARIKNAPNKAAKQEAVAELIKVVGA